MGSLLVSTQADPSSSAQGGIAVALIISAATDPGGAGMSIIAISCPHMPDILSRGSSRSDQAEVWFCMVSGGVERLAPAHLYSPDFFYIIITNKNNPNKTSGINQSDHSCVSSSCRHRRSAERSGVGKIKRPMSAM